VDLRDARDAGAISAVISLSAFSIMSGIVMVSSDEASHAVPLVDDLASCVRYTVDLRDARDACGDPSRDIAQGDGHRVRHRYG
jgi:hypothetical protein